MRGEWMNLRPDQHGGEGQKLAIPWTTAKNPAGVRVREKERSAASKQLGLASWNSAGVRGLRGVAKDKAAAESKQLGLACWNPAGVRGVAKDKAAAES